MRRFRLYVANSLKRLLTLYEFVKVAPPPEASLLAEGQRLNLLETYQTSTQKECTQVCTRVKLRLT